MVETAADHVTTAAITATGATAAAVAAATAATTAAVTAVAADVDAALRTGSGSFASHGRIESRMNDVFFGRRRGGRCRRCD